MNVAKFKSNELTLKEWGDGFVIQKTDGSGWIGFLEKKNKFYICDLNVKNNMRRQGIGSLLVKEVIKLAEIQNKDIHLTVLAWEHTPDEDILIKFYEQLGFKAQEEAEEYTEGKKGVYMIRRKERWLR